MIIDTLGLFFHMQCFKVLHHSRKHTVCTQIKTILVLVMLVLI